MLSDHQWKHKKINKDLWPTHAFQKKTHDDKPPNAFQGQRSYSEKK